MDETLFWSPPIEATEDEDHEQFRANKFAVEITKEKKIKENKEGNRVGHLHNYH